MPWLRIMVAVFVTCIVVAGVGSIPWMLNQSPSEVQIPSAVGLNQQDAADLALPFADVVAKRDDALVARMADGIDPNQARAQIQQLRTLLPATDAQSSRLVTWRSYVGADGYQLSGIHEYRFPDHMARTETVLTRRESSEPWRVANFQMNVATTEELAVNAFGFAGKPPLTKAIIATAAFMPFFILAGFLGALFRKGVRRRWLWALASLFGFGTLAVNVARGAWHFQPLTFQLFGASATWSGSLFDSWVFGVSVPIGAIAFWLFGTRAPKRNADALIAEVRAEMATKAPNDPTVG